MKKNNILVLVALALAACDTVDPSRAADAIPVPVVPAYSRAGEREGRLPPLFTETHTCGWVGSAWYSCLERPRVEPGDSALVVHSIMRDGVHTPIEKVMAFARQDGFSARAGRVVAEGDVVAWVSLSDMTNVHVVRNGRTASFRTDREAVGTLNLRNGEVLLGRNGEQAYTLTGRRVR